jgi:hypothetical protein
MIKVWFKVGIVIETPHGIHSELNPNIFVAALERFTTMFQAEHYLRKFQLNGTNLKRRQPYKE